MALPLARRALLDVRSALVVAGLCLAGVGGAQAQSVPDLFGGLLGGLIGDAQRQAAREAWSRVPPADLSCFRRVSARGGGDLNAAIQSGSIGPDDPRLGHMKAQCARFSPDTLRSNYPCMVVDDGGGSVASTCSQSFARQEANGRAAAISPQEALDAHLSGQQVTLTSVETEAARADRRGRAEFERIAPDLRDLRRRLSALPASGEVVRSQATLLTARVDQALSSRAASPIAIEGLRAEVATLESLADGDGVRSAAIARIRSIKAEAERRTGPGAPEVLKAKLRGMGDELTRLLAEPAASVPRPPPPQPPSQLLAVEVGPSFDCADARRPLEMLLCSTPELKRADLALVQPFYLMRHLAPDRGQEFRQEAIQFSKRVATECRVPETGTLTVAQARTAARCVLPLYGRQREAWSETALGLVRSGPGSGHAREEARRPLEQQLRLQALLKEAGALPAEGKLDGVFGVETRRAIASYQAREALTSSGVLSDETAERLGRATRGASAGGPGSDALAGFAERQRELPAKLGRLEIRYAEYLNELAAFDRTAAVRSRTEAKLDELRLALAAAPPSLVRDVPSALEAALQKVRSAGPLLSPNALVGLENETAAVIRRAETVVAAARDITDRSRFLLEGPPGDVLILYNDTPTAPSAVRTLSGAVKFVGDKPKACTTHRPIDDAFVGRELRERLRPAGIEDDLTFPRCAGELARTVDVLVLQREAFASEGLDGIAPVLKEVASGRFGLLATLSAEQLGSARAADARKKLEIEEGLGSGALQGFGLVLAANGSKAICRVIKADAQAHEATKARLASRLRDELGGVPAWKDSTEEEAFIALRRGECAGVYSEAAGLGRIRTALARDGVRASVLPIWITTADLDTLQTDRGSPEEPTVRPLQPEPAALPDPDVKPPPSPRPEPAILSARFDRKVALVIGNGAYKSQTSLPNPPNDSADVSAALRELGFDVVEGRDTDISALRAKARDFSRKLDGADLALFFYAGHGVQVAGRNYLVPVDAELQSTADLAFAALDVQQIVQAMESDERVSLVMLDACRDNPFTRSLRRSLGTRSGAVGQGLAPIQVSPALGRSGRPSGTMVAFATQPDNVALDGDGRNSPFTTALLKHLRTPGLEVEVMMRRVRSDVAAATKGKQVPRLDSGIIGGDVVLTAGR